MTAFYMTRLMFMTFRRERWTEDTHPHESPPSMTGPLILLAVGSVAAGALIVSGRVDWLAPVVRRRPSEARTGRAATVGIVHRPWCVSSRHALGWLFVLRREAPR